MTVHQEQMLNRTAAEQKAVAEIDLIANGYVMALFTPSMKQQMLSMQSQSGAAAPSRVTLAAVPGNVLSFNVIHGGSLLHADVLSVSDIAQMNGQKDGGARLQIFGTGSSSKALKVVQHVFNVMPELSPSVVMKAAIASPSLSSIIGKSRDDVMSMLDTVLEHKDQAEPRVDRPSQRLKPH